ncbi:MAG: hypothetical protein JWO36_6539 [Myxococcales bacterium]|nr:hypothetical protein [Myxococcales bacterium]
MTLPAEWSAICAARDLPAALVAHFAPVLATTPENAAVLARLCARATAARLDTSHEDQIYHSLVIDLGTDRLRCSRPDVPDASLPPSFARILGLHGRLTLVDAQVDLFYETYVEEEGWLDGTDLEGRGVFAPLRVYADLYIYHPDRKTPIGEPQLCFLDHVMAEEDGPQPVEGDLATVFLRHVASSLEL